jgi:hypothetical protein
MTDGEQLILNELKKLNKLMCAAYAVQYDETKQDVVSVFNLIK